MSSSKSIDPNTRVSLHQLTLKRIPHKDRLQELVRQYDTRWLAGRLSIPEPFLHHYIKKWGVVVPTVCN